MNRNDIKCSECNVVFKRLYDLRKHVKKFHEGKLDEIAPLCANTNKKTYNDIKCSECNSGFKRLYDLRKHVKKFHEGKLEEIAPLNKRTYNFTCEICKKNFNHKNSFIFHKKTHEVNLDEIAPLNKKTYNFSCEICKKNFNHKKHLTFHQKIHGVENDSTTSKPAKKCPLCSFYESSKTQLYNHFKYSHNIEMCFENFEFSTKEDFEVWKNSTEQISKSRFVKEKGDKIYKSQNTIYYICNRSGVYKPRGENKRHLKTQGSRKIGGFCPSEMKIVKLPNGQYRVTYIKTHVGHTADLGHLCLTTVEREEIAAKIALKIPFDHILDEMRDNISHDSIQRIHLLTKKDLHNIAASFNLQSEAVKRPSAISIEAWVKDSQCVLFYKPQNLTLSEHPELKSEDFVLIIMNEGQSQILKEFSSNCVCIDGTHGLNAYNFELHTLLVLNDLREGFPAAFLISNRSDQEVMTLFFSCIKEKIGYAINSEVFMSDMADSYYNAWKRVMNDAKLRLYCTWHVDRAWRKHLNLIKTKDKQVEIYKNLRTLLQETDEIAFLNMMKEFLKKSSEDLDTTKFFTYFNDNYGKNVKSWAFCYRLHIGLDTNMNLERIYETIKYIYLKGKRVKRLDKSVTSIMRFVKNKLFDREIILNKGKICSKIRELHHKSVELDVNLVEFNDGWKVFSSSNNTKYDIYEIHKKLEHCDCQLVCSDCQICIHKYSCSCLDSSVRSNMCEHIHLLGRKMLEQEATTSVENLEDQTDEGEQDDLHNYIESRKAEPEDLYKLLNACSSETQNKNLQEKKDEMKKWFCTVVESIQSDAHLNLLEKLVTSIEHDLKAAIIKDTV